MQIVLTPELLLAAYTQGLFPMADGAESDYVHWICPEMRGQLSIPDMHVPRRLKKNVRQMKLGGVPYRIQVNQNFEAVIDECGRETAERPETWINPDIKKAYITLHEKGFAHSVECYQEEALVGGLYGVAIGGAFFGESMFSRVRDASKVCLVHLAARLYDAGFEILDTQFSNDHLTQFGIYEVPHETYLNDLDEAMRLPCKFDVVGVSEKQLVRAYLDAQLVRRDA